MSIFEAYQSELKTLNELIVKSTSEYPKQAGTGKEAKEKAITEMEALFAQVSSNMFYRIVSSILCWLLGCK